MFPLLKEVNSYTPPRVVFGVDTVNEFGSYIKDVNIEGKAVVITDKVLREVGIVDRVTEALDNEGIEYAVYDKVEPEPDDKACDKATEFSNKNNCDFVIAVGGGSNIDLAKVVSEMMVLEGKTIDYLSEGCFPKKGVPIVTVVTTSGTGSEVTPYSVITTSEDGIKGCFGTPNTNILASLALVDPTLTISMPPKVTASTGIDALSHAMECVLAKNENPLSDAIAIQAIAFIAEALPVAVYEGDNLEARVKMSYGSMMAGLAFTDTGTIEGHAIAHTLGCKYHVPHGVGCGIATPYCMEYNMGHSMEKLAHKVAPAVGVNTNGMTTREAAQAAVSAVKQLIEDVGLPTDWSSFGDKDDIPEMVELMTEEPRIAGMFNPSKREMISKEGAKELLTRSYEGRLDEKIIK